MSKSLQTKKKFCVVLKEAASKIEIPKDFDKLDVVIGSKENCFSVNCAKYFSRLIKPFKEYYSFDFYYNFIKKIAVEENVLHCLQLKRDVQWMNVPWILKSSNKLTKVES